MAPAASSLQFKPANLTADHVQVLSDGVLFYIVTQGQPERGMPSREQGLSEQERWQVIRYLRTSAQ